MKNRDTHELKPWEFEKEDHEIEFYDQMKSEKVKNYLIKEEDQHSF